MIYTVPGESIFNIYLLTEFRGHVKRNKFLYKTLVEISHGVLSKVCTKGVK